jgi:putative sterol carrier protein
MVDKALLDKLRELREKGSDDPAAQKEAISVLFEVFKQAAQEDEELKEEVEDSDLCMQFKLTDSEDAFWISARDGEINYGEGEGPDVTVTMLATREVMAGILSREVDATSAYMAGDLVIEGNLQDAMAFGEIASLAGEIIMDKMEE